VDEVIKTAQVELRSGRAQAPAGERLGHLQHPAEAAAAAATTAAAV